MNALAKEMVRRDRAAQLAAAAGVTYDALDYDQRRVWDDVAHEAGRMIENATEDVWSAVAEDPIGALTAHGIAQAADENGRL